jgi:hypothetical protein
MVLSTSKLAGSTFFASEYNEITYNINHKQNYSAKVFQDGTNTIAVDKQGTLLYSVLTASETDDLAIQAAINYCNPGYDGGPVGAIEGTVIITRGTYRPSTTLHVHELVSVIVEDPNNTVFSLRNNGGDFAKLFSHTNWEGGVIYINNSTAAYTQSVFLHDPSTFTYPMSGWGYGKSYIRDVLMIKDNNTTAFGGTGIWFNCQSSDVTGIFGYEVTNIRITGFFDKGILLSAGTSNPMYTNCIAWNTFDNIYFYGVNNAIYLDENDNYGSIGRNVFTKIWVEPENQTTMHTTNGITLAGNKNIVDIAFFDDWTTDNGYCLNMTSNATKSKALSIDTNTSTQVTWNGTSTQNQIIRFDDMISYT